jgi:hypothetical protein
MLISGGRSTAPGGTTIVPAGMSSARKRMCARGFTGAGMRTFPSRSSASSKGTTASHPSGTGEPVMIFTAQPGATFGASGPPAAM